MAIKYLQSTDIVMFPSAFRNAYNPESKLTTEENITSLMTRLSPLNNPSYIIEYNETSKFMSINLRGYYFEFNFNNLVSAMDSSATKIYAFIKLLQNPDYATNEDNQAFKALRLSRIEDTTQTNKILDNNNGFEGLGFISDLTDTDYVGVTEIDEADTYYLLIAEKISGSWVIPDASRLKFISSEIDGGNRKPLSKYFETNDIKVSGTIYVGDKTIITDDIETQNIKSKGDLEVSGTATINTVTINGAATLKNSLSVTGNVNVNNDKFKVTASSGAVTSKSSITSGTFVKATSVIKIGNKCIDNRGNEASFDFEGKTINIFTNRNNVKLASSISTLAEAQALPVLPINNYEFAYVYKVSNVTYLEVKSEGPLSKIYTLVNDAWVEKYSQGLFNYTENGEVFITLLDVAGN